MHNCLCEETAPRSSRCRISMPGTSADMDLCRETRVSTLDKDMHRPCSTLPHDQMGLIGGPIFSGKTLGHQ
jgi:hypothetical protein